MEPTGSEHDSAIEEARERITSVKDRKKRIRKMAENIDLFDDGADPAELEKQARGFIERQDIADEVEDRKKEILAIRDRSERVRKIAENIDLFE